MSDASSAVSSSRSRKAATRESESQADGNLLGTDAELATVLRNIVYDGEVRKPLQKPALSLTNLLRRLSWWIEREAEVPTPTKVVYKTVEK